MMMIKAELSELGLTNVDDVKRKMFESYMKSNEIVDKSEKSDKSDKVKYVYAKLSNKMCRILTIMSFKSVKSAGKGDKVDKKSSNEEIKCMKRYVDEMKGGELFTLGNPTHIFICRHVESNGGRERHVYFESKFCEKQEKSFDECWKGVMGECQYLSFTCRGDKVLGMVSSRNGRGIKKEEMVKMLKTKCFATKIVDLPEMKEGKMLTYDMWIEGGNTISYGVAVESRGMSKKRKMVTKVEDEDAKGEKEKKTVETEESPDELDKTYADFKEKVEKWQEEEKKENIKETRKVDDLLYEF
jgi:hypothetical protein